MFPDDQELENKLIDLFIKKKNSRHKIGFNVLK